MNRGDSAFRRKDLMGTVIENSFSDALSFMRRKYTRELEGVDVAVTGIPFDQAVSNRPGARFGPEAVRWVSAYQAWGPIWPWCFDPVDTLAVTDYGDLQYDFGHIENITEDITQHISTILDAGASTLTIGGDQFITYPVLKAYHRKHGALGLVHFDAHRDFEDDKDDRIDHGTLFTRAMKDGLIDPERTIQIDILTNFKGERGDGIQVIGADEAQEKSATEIANLVRTRVGSGAAYLTFDIDCLDPTFAPGTGRPSLMELTSSQIQPGIKFEVDLAKLGHLSRRHA
jgi:agmatinase